MSKVSLIVSLRGPLPYEQLGWTAAEFDAQTPKAKLHWRASDITRREIAATGHPFELIQVDYERLVSLGLQRIRFVLQDNREALVWDESDFLYQRMRALGLNVTPETVELIAMPAVRALLKESSMLASTLHHPAPEMVSNIESHSETPPPDFEDSKSAADHIAEREPYQIVGRRMARHNDKRGRPRKEIPRPSERVRSGEIELDQQMPAALRELVITRGQKTFRDEKRAFVARLQQGDPELKPVIEYLHGLNRQRPHCQQGRGNCNDCLRLFGVLKGIDGVKPKAKVNRDVSPARRINNKALQVMAFFERAYLLVDEARELHIQANFVPVELRTVVESNENGWKSDDAKMLRDWLDKRHKLKDEFYEVANLNLLVDLFEESNGKRRCWGDFCKLWRRRLDGKLKADQWTERLNTFYEQYAINGDEIARFDRIFK